MFIGCSLVQELQGNQIGRILEAIEQQTRHQLAASGLVVNPIFVDCFSHRLRNWIASSNYLGNNNTFISKAFYHIHKSFILTFFIYFLVE